MECFRARESLSAMLDDEVPGDAPETVRAHLEGCSECAHWRSEASRLDRRLRLAPAPATADPDLADRVLAEVRLPRPRRWPAVLRAALVVVALAQLAIAAVNLAGPLGLHAGMPSSIHMDHEVAAFNLAFGVALLVVARRPRRARGQIPVLASFLAVLAAASAVDLTSGAVGWTRLATHAPIVVGLVLAAFLTRARDNPPNPSSSPERRTAPEPPSPRFAESGVTTERPQTPDAGRVPPPVARDHDTPWRRSA